MQEPARAVIESGLGERGNIRGVQLAVTVDLALQQALSLELPAAVAVAPAERAGLCLVQPADDRPPGPRLQRRPRPPKAMRRGRDRLRR